MTIPFRTPEKISFHLENYRHAGKSIGLVPTMGYLHEGHLSLVRAAKKENHIVVVSIFVNPIQFSPNEDLEKYPRDEKRDIAQLEKEGADFVFIPTPETMYLPDHSIFVEEKDLSRGLCGASRPAHFRGVCTVVLKLFNIIRPHRAYFGQKDYQQFAIIRRMVRNLNLPVEIRLCPIIRNQGGLALSSRNIHLSLEGQKAALSLSSSLREAKTLFEKGERNAAVLRERIFSVLSKTPAVHPEYVELRNSESLEEISVLDHPALVALAARVEGVRLIDNILLNHEENTGKEHS